ncbi:hypothetical protein [Moorena sp. SIO3H5]|nr:hypothetical protein [Moorena sp. SIO3H5]
MPVAVQSFVEQASCLLLLLLKLYPTPNPRFPIPDSRFPIPDSKF